MARGGGDGQTVGKQSEVTRGSEGGHQKEDTKVCSGGEDSRAGRNWEKGPGYQEIVRSGHGTSPSESQAVPSRSSRRPSGGCSNCIEKKSDPLRRWWENANKLLILTGERTSLGLKVRGFLMLREWGPSPNRKPCAAKSLENDASLRSGGQAGGRGRGIERKKLDVLRTSNTAAGWEQKKKRGEGYGVPKRNRGGYRLLFGAKLGIPWDARRE